MHESIGNNHQFVVGINGSLSTEYQPILADPQTPDDGLGWVITDSLIQIPVGSLDHRIDSLIAYYVDPLGRVIDAHDNRLVLDITTRVKETNGCVPEGANLIDYLDPTWLKAYEEQKRRKRLLSWRSSRT